MALYADVGGKIYKVTHSHADRHYIDVGSKKFRMPVEARFEPGFNRVFWSDQPPKPQQQQSAKLSEPVRLARQKMVKEVKLEPGPKGEPITSPRLFQPLRRKKPAQAAGDAPARTRGWSPSLLTSNVATFMMGYIG